jgi:uncharacterized protein
MIFVDTSAWFALFASDDQNHAQASSWFGANSERLLTTDYVVDEALTLFRSKGQRAVALRFGKRVLEGDLVILHQIRHDDFLAAWEVFRKFDDKAWSFTDCTSKVVMERLGIPTAFAFDRHFAQFGVAVAH